MPAIEREYTREHECVDLEIPDMAVYRIRYRYRVYIRRHKSARRRGSVGRVFSLMYDCDFVVHIEVYGFH